MYGIVQVCKRNKSWVPACCGT